MHIFREREQGHAELLLWLFESQVKKTGGSAQVFPRARLQNKTPDPFFLLVEDFTCRGCSYAKSIIESADA